MSRIAYWSTYTLWIAGSIAVAGKINREVTEPYMDEIFHVPQAQSYCRGEWSSWDSAITTPPGLYLIPAFMSHISRKVPFLNAFDPCTLDSLRSFNLLLVFILPKLYSSILQLIHNPISPSRIRNDRRTKSSSKERGEGEEESKESKLSRDWEGLVIAIMPAVSWWGWLYYTDLGSIVSVLWAFKFGLEGKFGRSSIIGGSSLWFRQTNIVWIGFIVGLVLIRELDYDRHNESNPVRQQRKKFESIDPLLKDARLVDLIRTPLLLLQRALNNPLIVIRVVSNYLPIFVAAIGFVKWNGGIVLGDKSNHIVTFHVPQVYYFVTFSSLFFAPHLLSIDALRRTIVGMVGSFRRSMVSTMVVVTMCWTIKRFTIAHPFLLADNRHFAFYVWRRIVNVHPWSRYGLAPGYFGAMCLLWQNLVKVETMTLSTLILFSLSTFTVLVPTPLIEPRYFLTPAIILRLYLSSSSSPSSSSISSQNKINNDNRTTRRSRRRRLYLETILYLSIQALTLWLFLERTFEWKFEVEKESGRGVGGRDERELGRKQRFMW